MRTETINIFSFEELSEEAQQKAIKAYIESSYEDPDILHFFSETCKEKAKEFGFPDITVQYSLSNCQGDGLSFECENPDITRFIKEALPNIKTSVFDALINTIICSISGNNGRYCYASKSDISFELDLYQNGRDYPNIENLADQVRGHITDTYMSLCKELENMGYAEIEYQTSEECAKEHFENNECEFYEDGTQY